MLVCASRRFSFSDDLIRSQAKRDTGSERATDPTSFQSWEERLPRFSASCKRDFLQAIDCLSGQVVRNFKQAFSYQSTRGIDVVLDVMTDISSRLMSHLNGVADSAFSAKLDQAVKETQMAFHISTHVVCFRGQVGVSVSVTEPSATLRLDESELRVCCETIEQNFRRAITAYKPRTHDEPAGQVAGFVVRPIDSGVHGFEVHRAPRQTTPPARKSVSEDLRFVSGRLSMKSGEDNALSATVILMFRHDDSI